MEYTDPHFHRGKEDTVKVLRKTDGGVSSKTYKQIYNSTYNIHIDI